MGNKDDQIEEQDMLNSRLVAESMLKMKPVAGNAQYSMPP
jgi:hypothetical protein